MTGNVDVLAMAETKLDDSFPTTQCEILGFKEPYISANAGGLVVYVKDHLISRELTGLELPYDIQILPIEINLRKTKWLLFPSYRPPHRNEKYFLDNIVPLIDFYSGPAKNLLIFGDTNMEVTQLDLQSFIDKQKLYSLIRSPTCFKGKAERCIDLMLTNGKHGFMLSHSFETGFGNFHHMIYTVLKTRYHEISPKTIKNRSYKKFSEPEFLGDVATVLAAISPGTYDEFEDVIKQAVDRHAPIKTAIHRGNNKPHINKEMRKAIMKRTRLKNITNKTKTQDDFQKCKEQRNLVGKMNRRAKR